MNIDDNSYPQHTPAISNMPTSTTCSTKERCEDEELLTATKEQKCHQSEKVIEANKYFSEWSNLQMD